MSEQPVVLVVDDDQSIVDFIGIALSEEGYRVETAVNGRQALQRVKARRPGLVLLDLAMPVMGGEEFCQRLSAEDLRSLPIIVMSASSRACQKAHDLNAVGWLGKPFDLTELISCVGRHCQGGPGSTLG